MESIILFVVVMTINLLVKSAGDKKKIEEARRKRAEQLKSKPEVDKINKQVKKRNIEVEERKRSTKQYNHDSYEEEDKRQKPKVTYESISDVEKLEKERTQTKQSGKAIKDIGGMDRKKLVNAIIWSEILNEPKSVQNIKKGM